MNNFGKNCDCIIIVSLFFLTPFMYLRVTDSGNNSEDARIKFFALFNHRLVGVFFGEFKTSCDVRRS